MFGMQNSHQSESTSGVKQARPMSAVSLAAEGFTGLEFVLDDERAFSPALFTDLGQRFGQRHGFQPPFAAAAAGHTMQECHRISGWQLQRRCLR